MMKFAIYGIWDWLGKSIICKTLTITDHHRHLSIASFVVVVALTPSRFPCLTWLAFGWLFHQSAIALQCPDVQQKAHYRAARAMARLGRLRAALDLSQQSVATAPSEVSFSTRYACVQLWCPSYCHASLHMCICTSHP